jgi:hypothetical protein
MHTKLAAGSVVETKCTRCRKLLNHTIVAMVGEKIVRVECNTCHGVHNYHPVKPEKAEKALAAPKTPRAKSTTPRAPKADPAAIAAAEWEALHGNINPEQAIPYDMGRTYRVNNLIIHTQFGIGFVQGVVPPNKIDVLFQNGKKRLRCG